MSSRKDCLVRRAKDKKSAHAHDATRPGREALTKPLRFRNDVKGFGFSFLECEFARHSCVADEYPRIMTHDDVTTCL